MSNTQIEQASQNNEESSVEAAPSAMTTKEATYRTMTRWLHSIKVTRLETPRDRPQLATTCDHLAVELQTEPQFTAPLATGTKGATHPTMTQQTVERD